MPLTPLPAFDPGRVGRWLASHTGRPELPWTFGVIDTPEINAFAAPGKAEPLGRGCFQANPA